MHRGRFSIWYVHLAHEKLLRWRWASVKNHGIPEDVIENVLSAAKDFFSLPLDEKMEVRSYLLRISTVRLWYHATNRSRIRNLQISKGSPPYWAVTIIPTVQATSTKDSSLVMNISRRRRIQPMCLMMVWWLGPMSGRRENQDFGRQP